MMDKLTQLAKITTIVAGAAIFLFLVNLLLSQSLRHSFPSIPQYSWITSQLLIFTIFKLSATNTNNVKGDASDQPPHPATTVATTTAAAAESDPMESPSSLDMIVQEGRRIVASRLRKSHTWERHCHRVADAEAEAAVTLRRPERLQTFKKRVVNVEREEEEDNGGFSGRKELTGPTRTSSSREWRRSSRSTTTSSVSSSSRRSRGGSVQSPDMGFTGLGK